MIVGAMNRSSVGTLVGFHRLERFRRSLVLGAGVDQCFGNNNKECEMNLPRVFFLIVISIFLSACATTYYPLGMSKQEWEKLPPDKQYDARAKQAQFDADAQKRREEAARQLAKQHAQEQAAEEARIRDQYKNGAPVIQVSLMDGCMVFIKNCENYVIDPFSLVLGEVKKIPVFYQKGYFGAEIWVSFQENILMIDVPADPTKGASNYISFGTLQFRDGYGGYWNPKTISLVGLIGSGRRMSQSLSWDGYTIKGRNINLILQDSSPRPAGTINVDINQRGGGGFQSPGIGRQIPQVPMGQPMYYPPR